MRALGRLAPALLVLALGGSALSSPGASVPTAAPAVPVTATAATAAAPVAAAGDDAAPIRSVARTTTTPVLPAPAHGRAAVRALGDRLPAVAAQNDRSAAELTRLLTEDPTMWVDRSGQLFVKDELRTEEATPTGAAAGTPAPTAAYPLDQTFALHSLPGSHRTIYLDFDGVDVGAIAWTTQGLAQGHQTGWDPSGNGEAVFDSRESTTIQEIWARVAEDYAPFDVDVTTADPGNAALIRTSDADTDYGTQVVFTSSSQAWQSLCSQQCGGIAWLGAFGANDSGNYQLAWVFGGGTADAAPFMAEAASHEAGHTFNLTHDGTNPPETDNYYDGHTPWAPIMGSGYDHAVTQWSKGDYASANNHQDDLAVIAARAPLRSDEAGDSPATAAQVPTGTAYVTSRTDLDYYALGTCTGSVTVTAQPAATGPDLDVVLRIVDSAGTTVATAAPATTESQVLTPVPGNPGYGYYVPQSSGMDASVTTSLPSGRYYAVVDGGGAQAGGAGDPVADYDDYASIGAYTLTSSGCTPTAVTVPGAPTSLATTLTSAGLAASWAAPTSDGGADLVGYDVTLDGGTPVRVTPDVTSRTWPTTKTGSHTVSVVAVNSKGAGTAASSTVRRDLPSAPVFKRTEIGPDPSSSDQSVLYFTTVWTPPADNGGRPVTAYRLEYEVSPGTWQLGRALTATGAESATTEFGVGLSLPPGHRPFNLRVVATNEVGDSTPITLTGQIPGPPTYDGAYQEPVLDKVAHTVTLALTAPYDGGSALQGIRVGFLVPGGSSPTTDAMTDVHDLAPGTTSVTFTGVPSGKQFLIGIEPYNAKGARRQVQGSYTMPTLQAPDQVVDFDPVVVDARAGTAALAWRAPYSDPDSAIVGYDVSVDGATPTRVTGTTSTVTGLALGSSHEVTVAAVNGAGPGVPYGPPSFRVVTTPTAVTGLAATVDRTIPSNLKVNLAWTASTDNGGETGGPVYQYRLQRTGSQTEAPWLSTSAGSAQEEQVPVGSYAVQVRAHNANGDSAVVSVPVTVTKPNAPGAVTALRVKNLDVVAGTATASWTAPDDGGSALGDYVVTVTDQATGTTVAAATTSGTTYGLSGLVRGHAYQVKVEVGNAAGDAPPTTTTDTFDDAPAPVANLQAASDRSARTVTATWTAPSGTGRAPIQRYEVRLGTGDWMQPAAGATSYRFDAVPTGSYAVQVRAYNGAVDNAGAALLSTASVSGEMLAPPVAPGTVVGLQATPDAAHRAVTLTWAAPGDNGGAAVTGYTVTVGSRTFSPTGLSQTVTGLSLGTSYRFTVAARNVAGTGAPTARTVVLTTAPAAPKIGTAKPGAKGGSVTAVFAWSAPTSTGGSAVTAYEVTVITLKGGKQIATKTSTTAKGARSLEVKLAKKAGVTYAAKVRAKNAAGWSPLSARSNAVTPR